jgi:hypothetical protein
MRRVWTGAERAKLNALRNIPKFFDVRCDPGHMEGWAAGLPCPLCSSPEPDGRSGLTRGRCVCRLGEKHHDVVQGEAACLPSAHTGSLVRGIYHIRV